MVNTSSISHALSFELLQYIRDQQPTEATLLEWLGVENSGVYHMLRKAGAIICVDEEICLSPAHYFQTNQSFRYEHLQYMIDEGIIYVY